MSTNRACWFFCIVVGLGGCSSRVGLGDDVADDLSEATQSESETTQSESESETTQSESETTQSESETTGDDSQCDATSCPPGEFCNEGVCEALPPLPDACREDADCGLFALCENGSCDAVEVLPHCGLALPKPVELEFVPSKGDGHSLTVADLDADGDVELVVVSMTLPWVYVFDDDSPTPTVFPAPPSGERYAYAGRFDLVAGDDVLVFEPGDLLWRIGSDGMGALGEWSEVEVEIPIAEVWSLAVGELDGQALDEIVFASVQGAGVLHGDGAFTLLTGTNTKLASVRDRSGAAPGVSLLSGMRLRIFDSNYALQLDTQIRGHHNPRALTDLRTPDSAWAVTASGIESQWTVIEVWDVMAPDQYTRFATPLFLPNLGAGDLDGDGRESLLVSTSAGLLLTEIDVCQQLLLEGPPGDIVTGDYDGDGDDEIFVLNPDNDQYANAGLSMLDL